MRQSSKQRSNDTSAIRKALAILEEEGLIIEETKDNVRIRRHSIGSSHTTQPQHVRRVSLTLSEATDDMTSCSLSHDGSSSTSSSCSYSCSSLKSDEDREVGGKGKRRSHTRRSKHHPHAQQKSKKEPKESTRNAGNKSKLSVRFSKYDQIEDIPNMNEMSQTEINATWMNEEDYEKIRSRSHKLIDMMADPQKRYPISADTMIVNTHLVCVRGLEVNTTQQQHAREQHRRKLTTAVLRLQQQQEEGHIVDDPQEALRQLSKKYSKKSIKTARFTGISDGVTI
mmetsp:Transcript_21953/g.22264  ORF Transcript_21953/g.22264 Transcript_21953/m.22264 type:complete len:283 (-) Transcript_21953:64-912(-)